MDAKATLEEFESILIDCATCPNKVLGIVAAGRIQQVFLNADFNEELRLAIIQSDAFTLMCESLNDVLTESMDHDRSAGISNVEERQRREREAYEDQARQETEDAS